MPRRALVAVSLVVLASCAASPAARTQLVALPEYPPPVEAPAPSARRAGGEAPATFVDLEGTTWAGPDSDGIPWSFTYRSGGALHYSLSGSEYDNGTWKQDGARVIMETNGHYADFTGTIRGSKITGSAHNKAGKSWTWVAEKQP